MFRKGPQKTNLANSHHISLGDPFAIPPTHWGHCSHYRVPRSCPPHASARRGWGSGCGQGWNCTPGGAGPSSECMTGNSDRAQHNTLTHLNSLWSGAPAGIEMRTTSLPNSHESQFSLRGVMAWCVLTAVFSPVSSDCASVSLHLVS